MLKGFLIFLVVLLTASQKPAGEKKPLVQTGKASYYGQEFEGRKTASGERFSNADFTAAHPKLPFNSIVRVTNLKNNLSITVRINDRGPFVKTRIIDLSESAARRIGSYMHGLASVKVEPVSLIKITPEIDSLFNCFDFLDCLGNPDVVRGYSMSLWSTKNLLHMLYVANELYLHEDVEAVNIACRGTGANRSYVLVITNIPSKAELKKRMDYFERKGFMQVKTFSL